MLQYVWYIRYLNSWYIIHIINQQPAKRLGYVMVYGDCPAEQILGMMAVHLAGACDLVKRLVKREAWVGNLGIP